jgi:uncharacterized protein YbjT (DUF2867 family)
MNSPKPIVVIGGTRGTGLLIANSLSERGYPVRVLARRPVEARARLHHAVQVMQGDLTVPATLPPILDGADHLVVTAGCRSGRFATEPQIRATEFEGMQNVLRAAKEVGFAGRLHYMNSSGVTGHSLATRLLNLYKGNTLRWRCRIEAAIRSSGHDYAIIRAGFLVNYGAGTHPILISQTPLPLSLRYRIARADVAEVFVAALGTPGLRRTTFEVVWGKGPATLPRVSVAAMKSDADPGVLASGLIGHCT